MQAPAPSTGTPKGVYLETFGCQMNQADSETALSRLYEQGYQAVDSVEAADLVLYNTCAVRDQAEGKVRGRLDALKRVKRERPGLTIGVMGCMAQRMKEDLLTRYPHVDLVVGTDQFVHLPSLLERVAEGERLAATAFGDFESEQWGALREDGPNAWVPIMRGCNYNCTYCIVPTTRGREKSRDPAHIEAEVRRLVAEGKTQVTLLGQTVDAYGKTLGDGTTLAGLLRRLHPIEGLARMRFVTSHPKDISDELLDTIAELPKVAKHLHVPAQTGSDRMLRLMGRRYTRDDYLRFVERARARIPGVELLSDFIVGFPRESDDDYADTESLMQAVNFEGAFVFMYSPRPGTGAARLEDDVPAAVKRARCNALLALQLQQQERQLAAYVGQRVNILLEGPSKSDPQRLSGRSQGNRIVHIPRHNPDGSTRDSFIGQVVPVHIERHTNLSLSGELVTP